MLKMGVGSKLCRQALSFKPYYRLNDDLVKLIHDTSMHILKDPGVIVFHEEAAGILNDAGAYVSRAAEPGAWVARIPEQMVWEAAEKAPQKVCLGARNQENALVLDGRRPGVYFGSGSESNFILDMELVSYVSGDERREKRRLPRFTRRRGTVDDLCRAAHLGEHLEHLDFFIRPVNIQDEDITPENKDVNKFFACLDNMTKHVMAGLTDMGQLDNVVRMAAIIAGGMDSLLNNPLISFISCVTKSPLQLIDDATDRLLAINRLGLPIVISSSPQGGSTAPIDEIGMVSQINAEILSGVVLSQAVSQGAPVIYGSVPVRARMDNLHDMYGAPEFNSYNVDCVQMAAFYRLPCYSTGGVSDAGFPGIQATLEKTLSHLFVTQSGPHLLHYAFGLLEETQTFSFEQALLDNRHIGMIKMMLDEPSMDEDRARYSLEVVRRVMDSPYRIFARYARKSIRSGELFMSYPFEAGESGDETFPQVANELARIEELPREKIPQKEREEIFHQIPGILNRLR